MLKIYFDKEKETIWLTQKAMAELFGIDKSGISRHLAKIFETGERENVFTMEKFSQSINAFLEFRRYDILKDNGKITHKQAVEKAYREYDIFNKTQPIESDFDRMIKELSKSQ